MPLLCSSKSGPTIIISHQRRSKMMYQRSSLLPLALCATVVSTASASAVAGGGHAPSDPLAAMAAYARFAHDVISLPAAAAKAQQKNQRNLQFTDGRWTQMASMCGAVGGSLLDGNRCEICPGDEDDGCCFIDLDTFAFSCNICETIDGVEECAEVQCGLTDIGGYTCDGCGDYSSGQACFNFDCDENGACTCNSITWNDQDCGECIIDEAGNPSFDCSAVGGPDGTTIGKDIAMPDDEGGETTDPPAGGDDGNGVIDLPQDIGEGDNGPDGTTSAAGNGTKGAASLSLLVGIAGAIAASA